MNLFLLFSQVVSAIKAGDYKTAACAAGRIITTVTCSTQAELLATARPKPMLADGKPDPDAEEPEPLTAVELYEACAEFSEELREACDHSESVCRMGAASNADLVPGNWDVIKAFLLDVLKLFIKRPADWQPAPFPAAPVAGVAGLPSLVETEGKPTLPPLTKPSERPKPQPVPSGTEENSSDESDEGDDEPQDEPPAPAPAPKPPAKPKK